MDLINIMTEKMTLLQCECQDFEETLKKVAKSIQKLGVEQPEKCLFDDNACYYPIDDCYNCPVHSWYGCDVPIKTETNGNFTIHIDKVDTLKL